VMFSRTILGNVDHCRTDCEISDEMAAIVAVVYEDPEGWHVNVMKPPMDEELETFNAAVEAAKQSLSHYVNRMGSNPPEPHNCGCAQSLAYAEGRWDCPWHQAERTESATGNLSAMAWFRHRGTCEYQLVSQCV
jgi:hypothetical protein